MIGIDLHVMFGPTEIEVRARARKFSLEFTRWKVFKKVWTKQTVDSKTCIIILYSFITG